MPEACARALRKKEQLNVRDLLQQRSICVMYADKMFYNHELNFHPTYLISLQFLNFIFPLQSFGDLQCLCPLL